jgi:3-phenylpropionate/trans-cinnamate dioxygenase ferredoxin subunit
LPHYQLATVDLAGHEHDALCPRRRRDRKLGMNEYVLEVGLITDVLAAGQAMISSPGRGADILVIRTRGGVFAVRAVCPHLGRSLADARIRGRHLVCPAHGRRYSLRTGRAAGRPGGQPLTRVRAWVDGGRLYLAVPADTEADHGQG